MKQVGIYAFGIFFALSAVVFAQEIDAPLPLLQKREEIKQHIEQKQIELHPQIQEKRQEIQNQVETEGEQKTKLQILAQERVLKIVSLVFEQLEAVLVKFDGIVVRIEARIAKLNEQGTSTTKTEQLLLEAKTQIEDSTALIAATKIELQTSIMTETSKEDIKKSIEACKTSLKETQQVLIDVIVSLKNLGNSDEELIID